MEKDKDFYPWLHRLSLPALHIRVLFSSYYAYIFGLINSKLKKDDKAVWTIKIGGSYFLEHVCKYQVEWTGIVGARLLVE